MSAHPESGDDNSGASIHPCPGKSEPVAGEQGRGRRRDPVPKLAAAFVLLIALTTTGMPGLRDVAGEVPGLGMVADDRREGGPATIPDRIQGYSYLTGSLSSSPPGRAIAAYQHGFGVEFLDFPQGILLGADADVYRRIDIAERRAGARSQGDPAPLLLAPDGGRIAVGSYETHGSLAVQDLSTGVVALHPVTPGYSVVPLAWSPDGRYIAALELPEALPYAGPRMSGPLILFDLPRSTVTRFSTLTDVSMIAFAPDSRQFAVQQGEALSVADLTGQRLRELPLPSGYVLGSDTAWSPDGELLAIYHAFDAKLAFLDPAGGARPTPQPILLGGGPSFGWTGPRRLVVNGLRGRYDGSDTSIAEVDLDTGARKQLTWVDTDPEDYGVGRFHLASGLLPGLQVRPASDVDRGPWPWWFRIVIGLPAAFIAGALILRFRRGVTSPRAAAP